MTNELVGLDELRARANDLLDQDLVTKATTHDTPQTIVIWTSPWDEGIEALEIRCARRVTCLIITST